MGDKKTALFLFALVASTLAFPVDQPSDLESSLFLHVDRSARIVGGIEAPVGRDPHMVVLTTGVYITSLLCGASLITQRTVLTAAHCIRGVSNNFQGPLLSSFRGTAGTNRLDQGLAGGVTFAFDRFVAHAEYDNSNIKNDIGILITRWNVQITERVNVIPIDYNFVGGNVPVRAAGFGRIIRGGAISQVLLELEMETIDGDVCVTEVPAVASANDINSPPVDPAQEICTFHSPGHGMCNGDSGSALTRLDNGRQVGLVSWGIPCALGGPDMFVRISAFQDWLEQYVV